MRKLALLTAIALLVAVACTNKKKDVVTTPRPSDRIVEQSSNFQIVGRVNKALTGVEPPVAVSSSDTASGAEPAPSGSPVGSTPIEGGVLRLTLEDASTDLQDDCGVAANSDVLVFWTTSTHFDPDEVTSDLEAGLEDHVAGVSGRVFQVRDNPDVDTPAPSAKATELDLAKASPFEVGPPGATAGTIGGGGECVLVADQVGLETATPEPTRAPTVRRTSPPAPTADGTERPDRTPEATKKPSKSPLGTATPTAVASP